MGFLSIFRTLPALVFTSYLPWYFFYHPKKIIKTYAAYVHAFLEIISIWFLLRTLLSPWKSIVDEYPKNLMAIGEIAQTFTLNTTTRIIGLIFRLVALVFSIISHVLLFGVFMTYLLLWFAYPFIAVGGIYYAFSIL